jgi:hypothetical protein
MLPGGLDRNDPSPVPAEEMRQRTWCRRGLVPHPTRRQSWLVRARRIGPEAYTGRGVGQMAALPTLLIPHSTPSSSGARGSRPAERADRRPPRRRESPPHVTMRRQTHDHDIAEIVTVVGIRLLCRPNRRRASARAKHRRAQRVSRGQPQHSPQPPTRRRCVTPPRRRGWRY